MSHSCKILLDSVSETGKRLTTFEITFPRCVLAEAETHRVFRGFGGNVDELVIHNLGINVDENLSRNSASSRAIPISRMVQRVRENPFIPEQWGKPVAGMGAKEYWPAGSKEDMTLTREWNNLRKQAMYFCTKYAEIGNKEDLNRALEPFMWHTAIITATEFDNFFKLRTNPTADWKIRKIADLMYDAYHAINEQREVSNRTKFETLPHIQKLKVGEWHCPLVYGEDDLPIIKLLDKVYGFNSLKEIEEESWHNGSAEELLNEIIETKKKISVARCARVSYLTHDGKRDIEKDLELFERLRTSGHWSPFEHVASPYFVNHNNTVSKLPYYDDFEDLRSGNFIGWKQYRKEFADENCTSFRKE